MKNATYSIYGAYTVLLFLLCAALICNGYIHGDIVRMFKKTQTKTSTTEWTEVLGKYCPRYTIRRTANVQLKPDDLSGPTRLDEELKMMFSFDRERFMTPFLTISDGAGTYLEYLEFTFIYSGDDILDFKWRTHYNGDDFDKSKIPSTMSIEFKWEEYEQLDINFSLAAFLVFHFVMAISIFLYIVIDGINTSEKEKQQLARQQQQSYIRADQEVTNIQKDTTEIIKNSQTYMEPQSTTLEEISEEEVFNFVGDSESKSSLHLDSSSVQTKQDSPLISKKDE